MKMMQLIHVFALVGLLTGGALAGVPLAPLGAEPVVPVVVKGAAPPKMTPVMVSVVTPVELPPTFDFVRGLRLNLIYGDVRIMKGLDIGLFNSVSNNGVGMQLGLFNSVDYYRGVQLGIFNGATLFKGLQMGVVNYTDAGRCVQFGLINVNPDTDIGFCPILLMTF